MSQTPIFNSNTAAAEHIGLSYLPAQFKHLTSEWIIEYYIRNPQSGAFVRKRIRLNRLKKRCTFKQFREEAIKLVNTINNKLAGGWSPLTEDESLRLYVKLTDVIDIYIEYKKKELRPDTLRTYQFVCNHLHAYCAKNLPGIYASMFNRVHAIRYMDDIYSTHSLSARTYNNRLKCLKIFFEWAKEKLYTKDNPFEGLKPKREEKKKRIIIPEDVRHTIDQYLQIHNPSMRLCTHLIFTSLIRPKECCNIRIGDINISGKNIYIRSENAKTHNARYCAISDEIIVMLNALQLQQYPADWYLFSSGTALPGKQPLSRSRLTKWWIRMRKELNLPEEMQLYSLRDTGINNMLKSGIPSITVMQHADHHDLAITTKYANHVDPNLIETINKSAPKF